MIFITLSADSYRLASLHDSSSNTYNLEASLPSESNRNEESEDRNRWTLKTGTELRENTVYSSFSHGMVPDLVESKTKSTEHISHILEKTCACIPTILCVLRVFCAVCAFLMDMFGHDGYISYESYGPL